MNGPVLVLGGTGMLGHKLWQVLSSRLETHVIARSTFDQVEHLQLFDRERWHGGIDATRAEEIAAVVQAIRPAVMINCIGIVKQQPLAHDARQTIQINSLLPHQLYGIARESGAFLIHISTDCVFSGKKGCYNEKDQPDPPDLYGRSKWLGEIDSPGCLTLRTSIIGRELGTRYGLVEWFMAQEQATVQGYTRAIYTGMPTIVLASLLRDLLVTETYPSGLYHLASKAISKYDLLLLIRQAAGLEITIHRDEKFACDRSLDGSRWSQATALMVPSWPEMIQTMIQDPTPYTMWRKTQWT